MTDLLTALEKFDKLLIKYPDDPKHSYEFLYFVRNFIKIKTSNKYLPIIELGAIIKHEKPNIYYDLKKMSNYNQAIDFITHVDVNYDVAKEKIEKIKENQ